MPRQGGLTSLHALLHSLSELVAFRSLLLCIHGDALPSTSPSLLLACAPDGSDARKSSPLARRHVGTRERAQQERSVPYTLACVRFVFGTVPPRLRVRHPRRGAGPAASLDECEGSTHHLELLMVAAQEELDVLGEPE